MDLNNSMKYNVTALKIGGLYKFEENGTLRRILYFIMRTIFEILLIYFVLGFALEVGSKGVTDFNSNAVIYGFMSINVCVVQRGIYYILNEDKSQKLVSDMNSFFKYQTSTLLKEENMDNCINFTKKLTIGWMIYGQVVTTTFLCMPLLSKHQERILAVPMWFPYDWRTSPLYEMTYAFQIVCFWIMVLLQTASDMFFAACVLQTAEQFKFLGKEFENLLYTNLIQNGIPKEEVNKFKEQFNSDNRDVEESDFTNIYEMCETEGFTRTMLNNVVRLTEFHQSLLSFHSHLEEFFSPLMLINYLFLMGCTLFLNLVVIMSRDTTMAVTCVPLALAGYFVMFVPCLMGNILTTRAEDIQSQSYTLPWYICDSKCKKDIKFILQKMSAPVTITVGKITTLDLRLFLWIVRTINSYCIALYQLSERK